MKILLCEACGGALKQIEKNRFICPYCETEQIMTYERDTAPDDEPSPAEKYEEARLAYSQANDEADYEAAARLFGEIMPYRDSDALMRECLSQAELCRKNAEYALALSLIEEDNIHFLTRAAAILEVLSDFKDSAELKEKCLSRISTLRVQIAARSAAVRKRHRAQRAKNALIYAGVALLFILISIVLFYTG